jgi:hypothetical protein
MTAERSHPLHHRCRDGHRRHRPGWYRAGRPVPQAAVVQDRPLPTHLDQVGKAVDAAFHHLVSAYEALEPLEASGGIETFPMSFELVVGSVCTALVALDDCCDLLRQPMGQ